MLITLLRHGRPDYPLKGLARSRDIRRIVANYDRAGIADTPPPSSLDIATNCNAVICSDLTRSRESARALGLANIHSSNPLFREVAIPHFRKGSFAMPVGAWALLLRTLSVFGFSRNGESMVMAKRRASLAADALIETAQQHDRVLLVGHGFINYFIARELRRRNWQGPKKPGSDYWQFGVYTSKDA